MATQTFITHLRLLVESRWDVDRATPLLQDLTPSLRPLHRVDSENVDLTEMVGLERLIPGVYCCTTTDSGLPRQRWTTSASPGAALSSLPTSATLQRLALAFLFPFLSELDTILQLPRLN